MDRNADTSRMKGVSEPRDQDRHLVERARDGDRSAAEALVERHWHACWRVARGILHDPAQAEDVVQESLVAALGRIETFNARRGTFAGWLYRITVNRALSELRRSRHWHQLEEAPEPHAPTAGHAGFLAAIGALSPDHRAVVVLRFGLDYGPLDIAEALGVPVGTVNSRLSRALEILRVTMEAPDVR
jgi:RNA polymerase sigma-70 factor (ECF subfamily)